MDAAPCARITGPFWRLQRSALVGGKIGDRLSGWAGTSARRGADALRARRLLAPAGEFSFVLLPLAARCSGFSPRSGLRPALAALTMVLGPVVAKGSTMPLVRRAARRPAAEFDPDSFAMRRGRVLVIGFGRFGQLATRCCWPKAST